MEMVKFENGVIVDVISTDTPDAFHDYVELTEEQHNAVSDIRLYKPDFSIRTQEEMYDIGAWERPADTSESDPEPETKVLTFDELVAEVDRARRVAYADPISGSDPLFAQYQRMIAMDEQDAADIKTQAIARYEEIRAEHPWPTPNL